MSNLRFIAAILVVLGLASPDLVSAETIFTENFETPVVSGKLTFNAAPIPGWINDYSGSFPERAGLWNEVTGDLSTPDGEQVAWMFLERQLTTTSITNTLELSTSYTLTFNVGAARAGSTPGTVNYEVLLLAGTSVVTTVTGSVGNNDLSASPVSHNFTTGGGHPAAGQTLALRLRMASGPWQTSMLYDDITLTAEAVSDTTSPTPNPLTWSREPAADISSSISMVASEASDASGVEYFFTNTVNGSVSGWQVSRIWADTGLVDDQAYSYKVKARDISSNANETDWSVEKSATVNEALIFADDFEFPKISGKHEFNVTPVEGWVNDYSGFAPQRTGYWNEDSGDFTTPNGDQAVWVWSVRQLTTITSFGVLEPSTEYTLSFLAGAARAGANPAGVPYEVSLMAGTNTITIATGGVGTNDLSVGAVTHVFTTGGSTEHAGEALAIRLRMLSDPDFQTQVLIDDLRLAAESVADTSAPTPNPPVWRIEPIPAPNNSITMTSMEASDPSGVEYFFTNTVNGNVSGWQSNLEWTDTGLTDYSANTYLVKARDLSSNLNETAWSPPASAVADPTLIFYDSFETPIVPFRAQYDEVAIPGWINDYAGNYSERVGLWNEASSDFTTPFGAQAAWVWSDRQLTTVNLGFNLESSTEYTLSFNIGAANVNLLPSVVPYEVQLLAGSTLIGVAEGFVDNTNLGAGEVTKVMVTGGPHPNEGEPLSIRLRMKSSSNFETQVLYDNLALRRESFIDTDFPMPDPSEWAAEPYADVEGSITMIARQSSDISGVQYFFTNTVNGNVSGWQNSSTWSELSLTAYASFTYKVKSRDRSDNQNETGWSVEKSAVVDPTLIFVDSFESPLVAGQVEYRDLAVPGWDNDYDGIFPERVGLWNEDAGDYQTPFGIQSAWVWSQRQLTATNIAYNLAASTRYTLTFNVGAARLGDVPQNVPFEAHLLAGSDVILKVKGTTGDNDLSLAVATGHMTPSPTHPNLGSQLSIRLLAPQNSNFQTQTLFDYVRLSAEVADENNPPAPDPASWAAEPVADEDLSITMMAEAAIDESGVQYLFTNTVNGAVSDWQDSPGWTDSGLVAGQSYTYRVKVRDNSINFNETAWSSAKSSVADPDTILYESFEVPDHADASEGGLAGDTGGWIVANGGNDPRAGINHEASLVFTSPFGVQAGWVREAGGDDKRHLVSSSERLSELVLPYTSYVLSFNVGSEAGDSAGYVVELMAGTNVAASASGTSVSSDVSALSDELLYVPGITDSNIGQPLSIRLRKTSGSGTTELYFDNVRLRAVPPVSLIYKVR